jgi:hypothetical protein
LPYFVRLVLLLRGADCLVQIRHETYKLLPWTFCQ